MHAIEIVDDEHMPDGHDFVFVDLADGAVILYRRSALTRTTLEDSWAAYRALLGEQPTPPGRHRRENVVWLPTLAVGL